MQPKRFGSQCRSSCGSNPHNALCGGLLSMAAFQTRRFTLLRIARLLAHFAIRPIWLFLTYQQEGQAPEEAVPTSDLPGVWGKQGGMIRVCLKTGNLLVSF